MKAIFLAGCARWLWMDKIENLGWDRQVSSLHQGSVPGGRPQGKTPKVSPLFFILILWKKRINLIESSAVPNENLSIHQSQSSHESWPNGTSADGWKEGVFKREFLLPQIQGWAAFFRWEFTSNWFWFYFAKVLLLEMGKSCEFEEQTQQYTQIIHQGNKEDNIEVKFNGKI